MTSTTKTWAGPSTLFLSKFLSNVSSSLGREGGARSGGRLIGQQLALLPDRVGKKVSDFFFVGGGESEKAFSNRGSVEVKL